MRHTDALTWQAGKVVRSIFPRGTARSLLRFAVAVVWFMVQFAGYVAIMLAAMVVLSTIAVFKMLLSSTRTDSR